MIREEKSLADVMRERLPELSEEDQIEVREMIEELENVSFDNAPKLVGIWAKARRRWAEITGEPFMGDTVDVVISVLNHLSTPRIK